VKWSELWSKRSFACSQHLIKSQLKLPVQSVCSLSCFMNTSFWLSTVWITFRVLNKPCFKIYTTKRIDKTVKHKLFVNTIDSRRRFRYLQILSCMYSCIYKNVTLSKFSCNKKCLANAYEAISDTWEFVMHTSHGTHPLLMRMNIVYTCQSIWYDTDRHLTQNRFLILTNGKYWYFQCTCEKQGLSRFFQDESQEKQDASHEMVVTYFWAVLYYLWVLFNGYMYFDS